MSPRLGPLLGPTLRIDRLTDATDTQSPLVQNCCDDQKARSPRDGGGLGTIRHFTRWRAMKEAGDRVGGAFLIGNSPSGL